MIFILMATYNGEAFLSQQLDSLFAQTVQDFVIYASDDGSTDQTVSILEAYRNRYADRMVVEQRSANSGGAKVNFMDMLIRHRENDYVMFCDQDDVWKPDKIEKSMQKMRQMENKYGRDVPLLVHTDLEVVDRELNPVHSSFQEMSRIAYIRTIKQAVLQNSVTGCTALLNRALAGYVQRVPKDFVMHDWWLLMVAVCFGQVGYIGEPTIYYRQHGGNSVGAMDVHGLRYKWYKLTHTREIRENMLAFYRQAGEFLDTYEERLQPEQIAVLQSYAKLPNYGKLGRVRIMRREGLLRKGFYRALSQYFFG